MSKTTTKLHAEIERLNEKAQKLLLEFVTFLTSKKKNLNPTIEYGEPKFYSGPKNESVMKAMKRLQKIYQMIDTNELFNDASRLMSEHILHGRKASEVITDMENLFKEHYNKIKK